MNCTQQIKYDCYNHSMQGKTIQQIVLWLKLKGIKAGKTTVGNWIREVKANKGEYIRKNEKISETVKYNAALSNTINKQELFNMIQPGDTISAVITLTRSTTFSYSSMEDVVSKVTVIEKYPYMLRVERKGKIYCIDKTAIKGVLK